MLQVLNSKDTRMRLEVTCFYHLVLQRLNHLSMAHHTLWPSESMHTTQLTLQTYTCFAKPTRVHSQQQRYLSRGSNREVNNARHRLRRTIRTSARFRLYPRGSVFTSTDWWINTVHNFSIISDKSTHCLSQWFIPRTSRRFGNKCARQCDIHYRHDGAAGRIHNGDLFTIN